MDLAERHPRLHISRHPLVAHKLSLLRDRATEPKKFRELVRELSWLLGYEAMADLTTQPITIETPLEPMAGAEFLTGEWAAPHLTHARLRRVQLPPEGSARKQFQRAVSPAALFLYDLAHRSPGLRPATQWHPGEVGYPRRATEL